MASSQGFLLNLSYTMAPKELISKDSFLMLIVLTLILGSLLLSVLDQSYRPVFAELAKLSITGVLGWLTPSPIPEERK